PGGSLPFRVAERLLRGNGISNQLLQFGYLRKTALVPSRPDDHLLDAHDEHAARARHQRDATELLLEGGQKLLRHPGGPQQPAALPAILDGDERTRHRMTEARRQRTETGRYIPALSRNLSSVL